MIQHIVEAGSIKEVDEPRAVAAILTLDGRMPKILEAGLVNTKRNVEPCLFRLRGLGDLLKAPRAFESKLRTSAKQIEAVAGMTSAFETFSKCELGMTR